MSSNFNKGEFRSRIVLSLLFLLLILVPLLSRPEKNHLLASVFLILAFPFLINIIQLSKKVSLERGKELWKSPTVALIIFLLIIFITSFFSTSWYKSFSAFSLLLVSLIIFGVTAQVVKRNIKKIKIVSWFLIGSGVVYSLLGIYFFIYESLEFFQTYFPDKGLLASWLLIPFVLSLILLLETKIVKEKIIYFLSTLIVGLCLFLGRTAEAWVSVLAILAIIIWIYRKKIFKAKFALGFLIFIMLFSIFSFGLNYLKNSDYSLSEFLTFPDLNISEREASHFLALNTFSDNWLKGVGYETLVLNMPRYQNGVLDYSFALSNFYLKILAEIGIFGIIALLWLMITWFKKGRDTWRLSEKEPIKPFTRGFSLGLIALAINLGLGFSENSTIILLILMITSGLIYGVFLNLRKQETETKTVFISIPIKVLALVVGLLFLGRGISFFYSNLHFERAKFYQKAHFDIYERSNFLLFAEGAYLDSLEYDIDPEIYKNLSLVEYKLARIDIESGNRESETAIERVKRANLFAKKVRKIEPQTSAGFKLAAQADLLNEDYQKAEENILKAIRKDPYNNPELYSLYLETAIILEDGNEALSAAINFLELYPEEEKDNFERDFSRKLVELNNWVGLYYGYLKADERAKVYFEKALSLDPIYRPAKEELKKIKTELK